MTIKLKTRIGLTAMLFAFLSLALAGSADRSQHDLDLQLAQVLRDAGFTGRIDSQLEQRLGRRVDGHVADLGRLLFFDPILAIQLDNSCAGCHSPAAGFGDTQSIAIGIDNNGMVGPSRLGPRNQRRSPMVMNTAFFPNLMWNSRFIANSGSPFDNSAGFAFPDPEGDTLSYLPHLLTAQAFIPPTERNEMAGFDFVGGNDDIRAEVVRRLNDNANYRNLFRKAFELGPDEPITMDHVGLAIAEFQFALTFADAPIDQFARGHRGAMSLQEKRGALLFFGKADCVSCHAVSGAANEMFSDFTPRVIGVPQVAPLVTNSLFDGPGEDEDFGLEQVTGDPEHRYMFRTSPLRNVGLQPTFFHNGAFTTLEEAIAHHLDVRASALAYSPEGRLQADLAGPTGPIEPVLERLDPRVAEPIVLTSQEFADLVAFVRYGLLDGRAEASRLMRMVPRELPSGLEPLVFEPPQ